ncbi:MAG: glycoside hydrolase 68 family protein, partial [Lactobacillus johnsonii]|nr:glycoside hydrolase 68 family protein [Lactobacillus johnsonii]
MLENKNHKKISLSGKSLLMGTLSTAAIILSASTANAATNESNTTASQNQTTSLTNVETKNNSQSIQRNEKVANQAANINEAPVGSAPVLDTPSSATDTTPGTDLSNNGSESVITDNSKKNNSKKKDTTQDISEKPELK